MSIDLCNESGIETIDEELVAQADFMLKLLHVNPKCDLSIMLVDEVEMADLHERYMNEPGPTDVLSFPMDELRAGTSESISAEGVLGDIVICPQVAARQAVVAGHETSDEMRMLLTHGMLHLLGHDHAQPEEHAVMFGLQATLLAQWEGQRNERGFGQ